jgi:DNA modification methylase
MLEPGGFRFLGIERDPEYVPISVARIRHVIGGAYRSLDEIVAAAASDPQRKQLGLF